MLEEYFKILGLPRKAKPEEIKKAYRFLAKKYHPDVSKEPDATKKFLEITEAYEILSNQKVLETLRIISENEEERKRNYEYYKKVAKEKARQAAEMRYEYLRKEHEAFQESGMYDLFLLLKYIGHFVLILVTVFFLAFPVYIGITTGFFGLFFFWIAGLFLVFYIIGKRKTYFNLGPFFYNFHDLKKLFYDEMGKATNDCEYCYDRKADSYPYKMGMLKVHGVQLNFVGALWHEARYNRSYKKISVPRCKKAFRIHIAITLVKFITIILALILLPFESRLWRFVGGIAGGGMLTAFILLLSHTRSKVSYLFTGNLIIRLILWLLLLIMLCDWNQFPDIQPGEYLLGGVIFMLFFQDIFVDIITKIMFKKINLGKPIIKQPAEIQKLFNQGYQNYLEIPVWSTLFPLFKWVF
jgi:curved DNA-binding protein CbpA